MSGHLFLVQGDLRRFACDAWLLPTDAALWVTETWWDGLEGPLRAAGARRVTDRPERWEPALTGNARVRALDGAAGPRPYLTATGAGGAGPDWYLEGARQFVIAAVEELREPGTSTWKPHRRFLAQRERPLLALPMVGTGQGGAWRQAGLIADALVPFLQRLAREHDVDLALVSWDATSFAAAQAARRRHLPDAWPSLDASVQHKARELARFAASGRLVLFLGAGISAGAGLPTWKSLLGSLASQAGIADQQRERFEHLSLLDQAQYVAHRLAESRPAQRVGDAVKAVLDAHRWYGAAHAMLAGLPVTEAITTNYDKLFELACERTEQGPVAILPYAPAVGGRWLLKMHGCLDHPEDIVLTRENYLRYAERNAALAGIVQAMLITRHMLFLGFSLEDDNFLRIVDDVRRAVRPEAREASGAPLLGTAVMLRSDPLLEDLWRGELDWLCPAGEATSIAAAARAVELFLDCLAFHASSHAHLLDERFDWVLGDDERALKQHLQAIASDPAVRDAPAWPLVRDLLRRLGGEAADQS